MSSGTTMPFAARTDVGQRREHNEDAMHASPPVFVVADGVGGSAKGEVASQLSIDTFSMHAQAIASASSAQDAIEAMERAVLAANSAVHAAQLADETLTGMATTMIAAVVRDGGEVIVGHVGDSRLYVLSAAGARQVTGDHSVVAELVRSGRIEAADAAHHPQRNVITRALGPEADVSVDAFALHVGPGDWLLACSDGLTEHVADSELARALLETPRDPGAAAQQLVALANERGGTDNITLVVAQPVPSDVSGELSIEALQAAIASTSQIPAAPASEAPADASGPVPMLTGDIPRAVETSGELPVLQPIAGEDNWSASDGRAGSSRRGWLLVAALVVVAALVGGFLWSQSFFLIERADGRVGINQGFPIGRLSSPHRSSDVLANELDADDRERLIDSHTILSRDDAERVLNELPERIDPTSQEATSGIPSRA